MSKTKTQVLIVGAGPTGLAIASSLMRQGIACRIIDKSKTRSEQSKALGVQAGSLESIQQVLGDELVQQMIDAGQLARSGVFHYNDRALFQIDFSLIPSLYNFILILAQSETERILENDLKQQGLSVERECELISLEEQSSCVDALIKKADATPEEIEADFIVGCDGAHSTVRHQLNISFTGGEYTGTFILGDVKLEWPYEKNQLEIFSSKQGAMACFPLRDEHHYRLILIPALHSESDKPNISLEEFSTIAATLGPKTLKITSATWLTRFSLHHRLAEHFRKGRVFLAGDAAHIHSPVGGQGMNTGIQEAFNLGFKLAQVLSGKQRYDFLNRYEEERYPIAQRLLRATDFASNIMLPPDNLFKRVLKTFLLPKLMSCRWIQRKIVTTVSEIRLARKEINDRKL